MDEAEERADIAESQVNKMRVKSREAGSKVNFSRERKFWKKRKKEGGNRMGKRKVL